MQTDVTAGRGPADLTIGAVDGHARGGFDQLEYDCIVVGIDGQNIIAILAIQIRFGRWQAVDLRWLIELAVEDQIVGELCFVRIKELGR